MTDFLRRYSLVSYLIALTFIINSIADAATNAWPWYPASEQWRFGMSAILSGYMLPLAFGLFMIAAIGVAKRRKAPLVFVSAASALLSLMLLLIAVSFILDTFQVRSTVREDQMEMFRIGAIKTAGKLVVSLLSAIILSIASWKAARDAATDATQVLMRPS